VLLLAGLFYLLLMGLNHWETRYYFFLAVLYAGLAAYAIASLASLIKARAGSRAWLGSLVSASLLLLVWGASFRESRADMRKFLAAQPWEMAAARDYLQQQYGAGVSGLRIVARKPHLPYLAGAEWVFFPPVRTLDEFKIWISQNQVDFIVIGKRELKERRELAPLGKPSQAPEWLRPVWIYDETGLILYRVGSF
jgi:hypothetical protein